MKKMKLLPEENKSTCTCCEALGTGEIVDWLAKQDIKTDVRKTKRGRPKKPVETFVDQDRNVMSEFYDIAEKDISTDKMMKEMSKLIAKDPYFLDPYLVIAEILFYEDKDEKAASFLKQAYEQAMGIITDEEGRLPKELPWGFLENRHLMRAINQWGIYYWETGKVNEALDIFRMLLKLNPQDNQGARYNILAINMGLGIDDWEKPFEVEQNGEVVGLDAFKVSDWFKKNAPKFEDDFKWLLDLYKEWEA